MQVKPRSSFFISFLLLLSLPSSIYIRASTLPSLPNLLYYSPSSAEDRKKSFEVSARFKMDRPHSSSYSHQSPSLPLHLCFFLLILFLFMGLSWYLNYESVMEDLMDQMKLVFVLSPLVLLLAVHWLSTDESRRVPFLVPLPERESFHRAGSSPWGVAAVLVLLLFMISYQSYFHERCFPLLSR